jgi:hypothetical protein
MAPDQCDDVFGRPHCLRLASRIGGDRHGAITHRAIAIAQSRNV